MAGNYTKDVTILMPNPMLKWLEVNRQKKKTRIIYETSKDIKNLF